MVNLTPIEVKAYGHYLADVAAGGAGVVDIDSVEQGDDIFTVKGKALQAGRSGVIVGLAGSFNIDELVRLSTAVGIEAYRRSINLTKIDVFINGHVALSNIPLSAIVGFRDAESSLGTNAMDVGCAGEYPEPLDIPVAAEDLIKVQARRIGTTAVGLLDVNIALEFATTGGK